MTKKKLYKALVRNICNYKHHMEQGNQELADKFEDEVIRLAKEHLPSGSGFDAGTHVDIEKSTEEKLVITTDFHHMDEHGGYDGWSSDIKVIVRASLAWDYRITVTGIRHKDRWHMQDYVLDTFTYALNKEVE